MTIKKISDLFSIPGYSLRVLSQEDIPQLQAFYERCADYSLLVDGYLPRPDAAVSLLMDHPPDRTVEDKLLIGIYLPPQTLVGILDAVKDYPEQGAWWIGLFLIDPAYRNQGLGRKVVSAFKVWLVTQNAEGILLGVVEVNEKAFKFWQSLGFEVIERRPPVRIGDLTHVVITMAHALTPVQHA